MTFTFFIAAMTCFLGVLISLGTGLLAMARNKNRLSDRMMRARVIFQGLTVLFLLLSWLAR